ncbi:MAG: hypothetical protein ACP5HM_11970 [Anaerolineae bacterium]
MDEKLLGKWAQVEGQPYPGLWFEFREDGTFEAFYEPMSIESGGTYKAEDGIIDMDQTEHTLGMTGRFKGRYAIEGDTLRLALNKTDETRPKDLSEARIYGRIA